MNLLLGITTFNRLEFLQRCIESWNETRNKGHDWALIIVDDGSIDGSRQWINNLNIAGVSIIQIFSDRKGVNYATNRILHCCTKLTFDLGFKIDDDIAFLKPGWDDLYLTATSKYKHLSFFDKTWGRTTHHETEGLLESSTTSINVQGCFWTFNQDVLQKVGYFDPFYGFIGYGDTDYTRRCCLAGFNRDERPYDAAGSNEYLKHGGPGYRTAISDPIRYKHNDSKRIEEKLARIANPPSIYVGFNEENWREIRV